MVTIIDTISFIVIIFMFSFPFLLKWYLSKKNKLNFFKYASIGLLSATIICLLTTWWVDEESKNLTLKFYGFQENDAFDFGDALKSVRQEYKKEAEEIYNSMFGIGWPLKAIFMYLYYSIYMLVAYPISKGLKKVYNKAKKTNDKT